MATGPGYELPNGLWMFGEDDAAGGGLFSDTLNIAQIRTAEQYDVLGSLVISLEARVDDAEADVVSVQTETALLDTRVDLLENKTIDTGWVNLTYSNSWANSAGAQYRVKAGICYLKGRITGGSTGTAFTLPVGARPVLGFTQPVTAGTGTTFSTHLIFDTSGTVTAQSGVSPNLNNISFPVD